jgi:hypothetical protein
MQYRIIPMSDGGRRVTTLAYRYRLARLGEDLWRLHWHPGGRPDVRYPHLHARFDGAPANTIKEHLPMGRATLEDAIRWARLGFLMARPDWRSVLEMTEADHLRYRSWHVNPDG